jgi:hypothetical protein
MAEESAGKISYTVDVETASLLDAEKKADKSLDNLQSGFKKTDESARSAGGGVNKLSKAVSDANRSMADGANRAGQFVTNLRTMLPVLIAIAGIKKMLDVQREFDIMNAGLITATKSAENARIAFDAISDFARNTPYDLQQAVDGFTKLVNLGLDPSERALMSYGNTASALGKDLNQMIEAVADASTGEFERLKEFGIKARKEGDSVSLTFQGVTTTIGNSAAEIEQYLIGIGENQFAGAMAERMKTLDGALANSADSWNGLWRQINESTSFGENAAAVVNIIAESLDDLSAAIASGELDAYFVALASKFDGFEQDVSNLVQSIRSMVAPVGQSISSLNTQYVGPTIDFIVDAFRNLPENVRAFIQLMVVEVVSGFDKLRVYANFFVDSIAAVFSSSTIDEAADSMASRLAVIDDARQGSIETIMLERDAAIKSFEDQAKAAKELGKEYDNLNNKATGDRLARFRIETNEDEPGSTGKPKGEKKPRQRKEKTPEEIARSVDPAAEAQYQYDQDLAALQASHDKMLIEDQRYLELKAQLETQHAENMRRIEEERFAAQSRANQLLIDSLNEVQAAGTMAITGLLTGTNNLTDAMQQLGAGIMHHAVGALVEMGIQHVKSIIMGQTAQSAAAASAAATGASIAASYAPAAAAVSLASYGANAAPANAGMASSYALANTLSASGGRLYGGPVSADGLYRVNENGRPEVFTSANGQQYMLPNSRGEVISNRDATGGGVGVVNNITITIASDGSADTNVTGSSPQAAEQLAQGIRVVVIDELSRQARPNGLLWNMSNGRNI